MDKVALAVSHGVVWRSGRARGGSSALVSSLSLKC